ncbi:MAG TPA: glycosyltransferase family 39 protein [Terriglobales bacterium]|nr:glycosyltransferase family 39 protein [Terriglobales bacterium]
MNQPVALQNPSHQTAFSLRHSSHSNYSIGSIAIIGLLWGAIYLAGMFAPALLDDADSVHAEAAREMVLRHDWVTLHTDGIRYLEKAPLMYWGVAGSYLLFGVSEWSTRLPLMLGVLGLLFATYALGSQSYGEKGGFYSALVLGTALGPYLFTRFLIPDILVGLWLTLGLYFFLRSLKEETPSLLACWGLAVTCALNVLTKGLIGLVFPVAIIGSYLMLTGNLRHVLRMRLFSSTLIFFAVAAPWHILAALRNPDQGAVRGFLWFYFVNEHFLRYLNKRVPPGYDTVPLLLFWGLLILWLFPWSVFLPQAIREVPWRRRQLPVLTAGQRANLLFMLWALVVVVFFSFSTRQEYYTIPALPGLALLVGGWMAKESSTTADPEDRRRGRISSAILFAIAVLGCIAGLALLVSSHAPAPGTDLAELLKKNPQDYDFSLGHLLDLTPQALGAFRVPLAGAVVSLFVGTGANWFFRKRGSPWRGNVALAVMMIALLACVQSAFVTFSPILSSKQLAVAVQHHYRLGDIIVVDAEYSEASTLNFYTGVPIHVLREPSGNLWYGAKFPDAPHVFETESSLAALWTASGTVFLWTEQEDPKQLHGAPRHVLAHSGGKFILTNHDLKP